jgi:hypothetical protein
MDGSLPSKWLFGYAFFSTLQYTGPQSVQAQYRRLIHSLKLRKACGIDGIPKECLRHLPRRPMLYLTHFNHSIIALGCPIFQILGRKQKSQSYRNTVWSQNPLKIYVRLAPFRNRQTIIEDFPENIPKAHWKKGACLTHASLVSVHVTAGNCNVWGYRTTWTNIFVILDKAKPDIQSIRGLYLAVIKHTTFQVVAEAIRNRATSSVLSLDRLRPCIL